MNILDIVPQRSQNRSLGILGWEFYSSEMPLCR